MSRQWVYLVHDSRQHGRVVAVFDHYGCAMDYVQERSGPSLRFHIDMLPLNISDYTRPPSTIPDSTLESEQVTKPSCYSWIAKLWK